MKNTIQNIKDAVKNTPITIKALVISLPLLAYGCGDNVPEYTNNFQFERPIKSEKTLEKFVETNENNILNTTYTTEDMNGIKKSTYNKFGNLISVERYDSIDQQTPNSVRKFTYWANGPQPGELSEIIDLNNVKGELKEVKKSLFAYDDNRKLSTVEITENGKTKSVDIKYDNEGRIKEQILNYNNIETKIFNMYDGNELKTIELGPESKAKVKDFKYENGWIKK